jgi:hypothetical protein
MFSIVCAVDSSLFATFLLPFKLYFYGLQKCAFHCTQKFPSIPTSWPFLFFYLGYETIGTAATPGLLCQPRVIMKMTVESMMKCRLAGETEVLAENLPQRHFCPSQNPTCPPGLNPGRRGGKPATNRLSYGVAIPLDPCWGFLVSCMWQSNFFFLLNSVPYLKVY